MLVKVCNADFSLQWDGMYQFALENYPQIQEWELEKLAKFIAYEQDHHRQTIVECENHELNIRIHDYLQEHSFFPPYRPSHRLVASTYDIQRKLVTSNYCSHTCTVEVAQAIFQTGKLMSAVKVFGQSGAELVTDGRNAASDPADYFDYIMFGWSNTTSGYRLAMERLLGRVPSEEELQEKFIPGVSFHFLYEELIQAPGYMFDGYHVAKVRNSLDLDTFLHLCIIPSKDKACFEGLISSQLQDRVIYLDYEGEGLQDWNTKVNQVLHSKVKLKE